MSSVTGVGGGQQQYLQPSRDQTNPPQTSQGAPETTTTKPAAAAGTKQSSANSSAEKTQTQSNQNAKPPQAVTVASGAKSFESAATRNADGTFGPKHTLRPPLSYTLLHESTAAPKGVDVKA